MKNNNAVAVSLKRFDLLQMQSAPLFSEPSYLPAELRIRQLKPFLDDLLLQVMAVSVERDNEDGLCHRVAQQRSIWEATDQLTQALRVQLAAYRVFDHEFEIATRSIDQLWGQGFFSDESALVVALSQLFDRRFQEARDALHLIRGPMQLQVRCLMAALDVVVAVQVAQTPYADDAAPTRSYVVVSRCCWQLDQILWRLNVDENVILVQDRDDVDALKCQYHDSIRSIETEHRVWETYPDSDRKIRLLLKNNNNGNDMKALKMGIRKAYGAGAKVVLTYQQGQWSEHIATQLRQADAEQTQAVSVAMQRFEVYAPRQKIALLSVTKDDRCHGVPIVLANIVRGLNSEPFSFVHIINDFDTTDIQYYDECGQTMCFDNRGQFLNFVRQQGIAFSVLHFHSWHFADYYKPFHSARDPLDIMDFIALLGRPKVVYTDHSNPMEDIRRIQVHHGINYGALSDDEKETFLRTHNLNCFTLENWQSGWEATSILSRRQMMQLADCVTNVSATQRDEEYHYMLPNYAMDGKHIVIWNGTDMLSYKDLPLIHTMSQTVKQQRTGQSVLYAGRAEKEKGIFDLAIAAKKLRQSGHPVNIVYIGDFQPELQEKLDRIAGQQNIYTGVIYDRIELASQYAATDLIAQPTWGECFNQVVSEGLAIGTPAVVANISGPKEVYVNNGIAVGHQVRCATDLAQGIKRVLTDEILRNAIIRKGSHFVGKHLSASHMANQYGKIYGEGNRL